MKLSSALLVMLLASRTVIAADDLKITAIDVEGGFATLYVTPQGHSLLIDTGWPAGLGGVKPEPGETLPPTPSSAERIAAAVKAAGLKGIDYLLVTHYHVDHVGGAVELMSLVPVGTVLDHGPNREELSPNANPRFLAMAPATLYPKYLEAIGRRPHRVLKPGDTLSIDAMQITAVDADGEVLKSPLGKGESGASCATATTNDNLGGEENPRSLGVLITWGKARVLSLGDTTWNVENRLACPKDLIGPVDLMFADNHGTDNANSPTLLNTVQPRVVVFNNGAAKGAAAPSIQAALATPRIKGIWQIHFQEQHPDTNAPQANIANLSGRQDERWPLQIAVSRAGELEFTNPRTGEKTRY
jgi:beta-lactamase superfamily II metal-dependent hydrolase